MDILQPKQFDALAAYRAPWCVSIYLPTFRTGSDALQNHVRLKNLLRVAEIELIERGMPPEARDYLDPAHQLHDNVAYWQSANSGLALFLGEQFLKSFRVPQAFRELAVVGKRFHIKPLLPLVSTEGRFLVLAVSANKVRLLEGTRWQTTPIDLSTLPKNLVEALHYDQPEVIRNCHSAGSSSGQRMSLAFHGQGGGVDAAKGELMEYFLHIDRGLKKYLADKRAPLVFAGVDSLFPIYQHVNSYAHLQPKHIGGNTDLSSETVLHDRAWEIVEPLFRQGAENALARCCESEGGAHASHDLLRVLRAARQGAVETLLVDPDRQQWGLFDADAGNIYLPDGQRPGNEELLDLAVSLTLAHRGKVYPVPAEQLPERSPVAAVFRYALSTAEEPAVAQA